MKPTALSLIKLLILLVLSSVVSPAAAASDDKARAEETAQVRMGGIFFGSFIGGGLEGRVVLLNNGEPEDAFEGIPIFPGFLMRIASKKAYRYEFEWPIGDLIYGGVSGRPALISTHRWVDISAGRPLWMFTNRNSFHFM